MARAGGKRLCLLLMAVMIGSLVGVLILVLSDPIINLESSSNSRIKEVESHQMRRELSFLYQKGRLGYKHVWPEMKFGWKIVLGTIIAFIGAACGSVGGIGGGGIFVPMLTLIIGFDAKSSAAISKCIITGAAGSTVYYNLKLRHPTLDLPIIDYDLTLLLQPMLVLGICIGVALNVVFADWMITILLIIFFIDDNNGQLKAKPPLENSISETQTEALKRGEVSIIENVYRKELGLLVAVWLIILGLQIGKNYVRTCSVAYWALNTMQIPVAVGVTSYEALGLYKGQRKIASKGETITYWRIYQLVLFSALGLLAGIIGGMLGIGGGFILGPLFLEMGIPPQVSSATATFAMTFSASMSAIEYYLLKRFPVPYALYFFAVAIVAAFVGQHVVKKLISLLGRASIIIFVLAFTIFASTLLLGGIGIDHMIKKIQRKEYMGFESLCS